MTLLDRAACDHPTAERTVIAVEGTIAIEKCGKCGFSIEDGEVSEFRTCPFCDDWFIDRFGADDEVCCQGCGATAPQDIWNKRVAAT